MNTNVITQATLYKTTVYGYMLKEKQNRILWLTLETGNVI